MTLEDAITRNLALADDLQRRGHVVTVEALRAAAATVPELRTAASTMLTTVEVERRLGLQLRRVDDGYMRVVEANVDTGKGTYEARANGKTVTKSFAFDVVDGITPVLRSPTFAAAEAPGAEARAEVPDPYARRLKQLRAAAATDLSRFEDEWKAARLRELAAEAAAVAAEVASVPRMTAAEEEDLASYAPPDAYAVGLKALREKEQR